MSTQEHAEMVAGIRQAADWLEQHPEMMAHSPNAMITFWPETREGVAEFCRAAAPVSKNNPKDWESTATYRRGLGPYVYLQAFISRERVCRKVEVGTRKVERVDPAIKVDLPMVVVEEPVYAWRCDPVLGKPR